MLAVERSGSGRPLVLIHGLGGPRMWEKLLPLLAPHFSVTSVHLPGFGNTPPLARPPSGAELASHIAASMPEEPAVVVATSYGGQLAVELAAREPSAVVSLVLVASSGVAPKNPLADHDAAWKMFSLFLRHLALRSGPVMEFSSRRSFYDIGRRPADLVAGFREQMAGAGRRESWIGLFRNALRSDPEFERKLQAIRVPTLIVAGDTDRIVPPASARRLHERVPGSHLHILARCGHSVALEEPELLRDLILGHARR